MRRRKITKQPIIIQVFWVVLKIAVKLLRVVVAILPDESPKPRYSATRAHFLHEEKLISDMEYAKAIGSSKHKN